MTTVAGVMQLQIIAKLDQAEAGLRDIEAKAKATGKKVDDALKPGSGSGKAFKENVESLGHMAKHAMHLYGAMLLVEQVAEYTKHQFEQMEQSAKQMAGELDKVGAADAQAQRAEKLGVDKIPIIGDAHLTWARTQALRDREAEKAGGADLNLKTDQWARSPADQADIAEERIKIETEEQEKTTAMMQKSAQRKAQIAQDERNQKGKEIEHEATLNAAALKQNNQYNAAAVAELKASFDARIAVEKDGGEKKRLAQERDARVGVLKMEQEHATSRAVAQINTQAQQVTLESENRGHDARMAAISDHYDSLLDDVKDEESKRVALIDAKQSELQAEQKSYERDRGQAIAAMESEAAVGQLEAEGKHLDAKLRQITDAADRELKVETDAVKRKAIVAKEEADLLAARTEFAREQTRGGLDRVSEVQARGLKSLGFVLDASKVEIEAKYRNLEQGISGPALAALETQKKLEISSAAGEYSAKQMTGRGIAIDPRAYNPVNPNQANLNKQRGDLEKQANQAREQIAALQQIARNTDPKNGPAIP